MQTCLVLESKPVLVVAEMLLPPDCVSFNAGTDVSCVPTGFASLRVREAREEAGVGLSADDLRHVHTLHVNGSGLESRLGLCCEPVNREPRKCSAVRWFALDALPAELIEYPAAGLDGYLAGTTFGVYGWTISADR